jgi:hypothetical protein
LINQIYFNTKLYTGNSGTQAITGVGFQPNLSWTKVYNTADANILVDSVRGDKVVRSDTTGAEYDTGVSWTFDTDGFTMTGTTGELNYSGRSYVVWNWLAGGTASSNTDGSITSSVSANTTSGFSIVSYTGNGSTDQTIGHGLGVEPDFIIIKARSTTMNWPTYQKVMGNGVVFLDVTDAWASGGGYDNYWYTSGMTSSTFGISDNINTNTSSATFIAYCFAEKQGYSKFGSYTGNGDVDGPFVYTGFKPAFVMVKPTSTAV